MYNDKKQSQKFSLVPFVHLGQELTEVLVGE
jgi:hypothetical protein